MGWPAAPALGSSWPRVWAPRGRGYTAGRRRSAMAVGDGTLAARRVVDELRANGVTHVIWLVDTESRFMYDALTADPELTVVPICREGEAMGVALGLQIGGKKPIVVIQNTGFFESGDSIRGLVL